MSAARIAFLVGVALVVALVAMTPLGPSGQIGVYAVIALAVVLRFTPLGEPVGRALAPLRRWFGPYFLPVVAVFGFAFLYAPIVSLVVFSFNESRLVTVWGGFSTRWYGELLSDGQMLAAAWISLKVATVAASLATVIGTLAAFVLTRFDRFPGKLLLNGMVTAPLVMPDVIIGLSLLLLFVAMELMLGWPSGRGLTTLVIAHSTFTSAYVAVIAQSRLRDMDESLEEAARDLGAGPVRVFFDITLPVIAPALVSGWLLAFTLSLDDLVIASFVSGPGASTLPMVIFSKVRLGVSPDVNALATIIIGIVAVAVTLAGVLLMRQSKKAG